MNEIFERAIMIMNELANCAGEGFAYQKSWDPEFRCSEVNRIFVNQKAKLDESFWNKVFNLSVEEKLILGFRAMDNESKKKNKLNIPIWIWNLLPDDMYIEDGGKTVKELDNDNRFGVVWWKA